MAFRMHWTGAGTWQLEQLSSLFNVVDGMSGVQEESRLHQGSAGIGNAFHTLLIYFLVHR